jgi:hypothetical protein
MRSVQLSPTLNTLPLGLYDPRAEARRTEAVLDRSGRCCARGRRAADAVSRAVARDKPVATSVVIPRQFVEGMDDLAGEPFVAAYMPVALTAAYDELIGPPVGALSAPGGYRGGGGCAVPGRR